MDRRQLLATFAMAGLAPQALAQGVQRRMIFPFAAGGAGDTLTRILADGISNALNDRVIVENRTGAGGRLGVMAVKQSDPDARTLLLVPFGPMSIFPIYDKKLAYDPFKDFAPVSQVATFDFAVGVGKDVPAKTLTELVRWIKQDNMRGSYGTPGAGTLPHFFAVSFQKAAGIELTQIAYRGSAAALSDVLSGKLPIIFTTTSDLVQQFEAGTVRILATSGAARSPFISGVPTFREAGYPIEGDGWYGVFAAAGSPALEVKRLSDALNSTLKTPEVRDRLAKIGLVATGTNPEVLAKIQRADFDRWTDPVKASGFTGEQ